MKIDKLKLIMRKPIPLDFNCEIKVYQPLVSEIVDIGEEGFKNLYIPYMLTLEAIFGYEKADEIGDEVNVYDLFFLKAENGKCILDEIIFNGNETLDSLKESLSYFLKTDDIKFLENRKKIIINDSIVVGKKEFEEIALAIRTVTVKQLIEVERPPKNMSERKLDIWKKLQAGRKRKADKNTIYLQDIINFVINGGLTYIDTEKVANMTYYELGNTYKAKIENERYYISNLYKISQKFDFKDEIKHWTETLKIGK